MYLTAKRQFCILLHILVILSVINFSFPSWAQSTEAKTGKAKAATSSEKSSNTEVQPKLPVEETTEQPSKVDIAGEKVGRQVDDFTQQASSRFGGWINAKVFAGITWLKLILSLLLLFFVLLIERIVRLIIDRKRRKAEEEQEAKKIKYLVIQAVARPLSMFIWVYGIYIVLTPLFVHFRRPDGTNLVYTVAQKAADLGAAVAVVWFIFMLVSIVDFHLKKWAASTDSTIDDILAPLFGKTLRIFIVIIGGILIIQNLTGVKIGPLLASLGIVTKCPVSVRIRVLRKPTSSTTPSKLSMMTRSPT